VSTPPKVLFHPDHQAPGERTGDELWFAFRRRELLVHEELGVEAREELAALGLEIQSSHYLGRYRGRHTFAAEIAESCSAPPGFAFRELFGLYGRLPDALQKLAGRAIQILEWDRTHRFCGACGRETEVVSAERARVCPACGLHFFPRVAPSMIVAVERDEEILLARSPHFPPGIFSVLAGFVEPGESVEDTIHREVYEEVGIEVSDLHYFGSQPWPHPHSLMLGYQARHTGGELRIDGVEIEEAGWYRADDMPRTFPGRFSIAQWLIHDFLARNA